MSKLGSPLQTRNSKKSAESHLEKEREEITLDSLAALITESARNMESKIDGLETKMDAKLENVAEKFSTFNVEYVKYQEGIETRLKTLEVNDTEEVTNLKDAVRDMNRIDNKNYDMCLEMCELRKENLSLQQQMIHTQAVLRNVAKESNLCGRAIKERHIRFGKIAESAAPDRRGATTGYKPREDSKHVIAEFISKNKLHPDRSTAEIKGMIETAFRIGTVEVNKVRNMLVKFKSVEDRNIVMRNGKIKERKKGLGNSYLMDDHTQDDYSRKRRCHAIMKKLKNDDKKPYFGSGSLKTTDGGKLILNW